MISSPCGKSREIIHTSDHLWGDVAMQMTRAGSEGQQRWGRRKEKRDKETWIFLLRWEWKKRRTNEQNQGRQGRIRPATIQGKRPFSHIYLPPLLLPRIGTKPFTPRSDHRTLSKENRKGLPVLGSFSVFFKAVKTTTTNKRVHSPTQFHQPQIYNADNRPTM